MVLIKFSPAKKGKGESPHWHKDQLDNHGFVRTQTLANISRIQFRDLTCHEPYIIAREILREGTPHKNPPKMFLEMCCLQWCFSHVECNISEAGHASAQIPVMMIQDLSVSVVHIIIECTE